MLGLIIGAVALILVGFGGGWGVKGWKRKEVQLGVNVEESLMELAKTAGKEMRLKPCK